MSAIRVFRHYAPHLALLLGLIEATLLYALFAVSNQVFEPDAVAWRALSNAAVYAALVLVCLAAMGLYTAESIRDGFGPAVPRILAGFAAGAVGVLVLGMLVPSLGVAPRTALVAAGSAIALLFVIRGLVFPRLAATDALRRRVLVVGAGQRAQAVTSRLQRRPEAALMDVVGYVPVDGDPISIAQEQLLPPERGLVALARSLRVDEIVLLSENPGYALSADDALDCGFNGILVSGGLDFFERELRLLDNQMLRDDKVISWDEFHATRSQRISKRAFDFTFAAFILLVSWPLWLLTAIAIKLEEGRKAPLFYSQLRVGKNGKTFRIYKFRSMRTDAEAQGARFASKNDPRITRVGGFIRLARIDELPQIWNVFAGHMSIVGPRPERPEFVEKFEQRIPFYRHRHQAQPGLAGWAQLCYPYGDGEDDAREKLQFDLYYVKNQTFFLDIIILIRTAEIVFFGRGAR